MYNNLAIARACQMSSYSEKIIVIMEKTRIFLLNAEYLQIHAFYHFTSE